MTNLYKEKIRLLEERYALLRSYVYKYYNLFPAKDRMDKTTSDKISELDTNISSLTERINQDETIIDGYYEKPPKERFLGTLPNDTERIEKGEGEAKEIPAGAKHIELRDELIKFAMNYNDFIEPRGRAILERIVDRYLKSKEK